jgi:F0F1-type ATP synthase membrane subunit b/b'
MLIVALVVFQLLFFIGLIVMLRRIMTQNVASATQHLNELNQDYTKKEEEVDKQLAQVKAQSQEIIAKAQEEATRLREQTLKEAQDTSQKIVESARAQSGEMIQQADKSRQALLGELDERIAKESIQKAVELMSYALPDKFKQEVHTHWVDELIAGGFHEIQGLNVSDTAGEVKITTAFVLSSEQHKAIARKIKDVFGRDFSITEDVRPEICAGIVITIGSLVLDGSLKNKIQEQARQSKRENQ